ncbi:MAG: D-lactate dehydrogenase, partial [Planctomycetota bacterium]|nr:D-lactate dehydrogenase [Planctomycetota bacterium]
MPPAPTQSLIDALREAVGGRNVITEPSRQEPYCRGFRFGEGSALAVLKPDCLVDLWRALRACVAHDVIVVMQAANTGLTGGSTPSGDDYDR